ncbi:hypothetical protein GGS21DRAFT_485641 [Xylaria nigripes]|nr:hypothetical protein GGS21DRAFT_485641 [Xylaria nigripes]
MTAPNSTEGDTEPSGPQTTQPDAATQSETATQDDTATQEDASTEEDSTTEKDAPIASASGTTETVDSTQNGNATTKDSKTTSRRRAATLKPPPTLLGDFLLGRQSPARIAADKKAAKELVKRRRMSLEAVKNEMRQAAVQRIQAPGGVRDRVTKWQKANAIAIEMAKADPLAAPSEPTEVNVQVDDESVTEEDRVRIKMRQKKRPPLNVVSLQQGSGVGEVLNTEEQKKVVSVSPPKKRVVSDTNWVKNQGPKTRPANAPPKTKLPEGGGSPLPKDFLSRSTPNPPVAKKIQEWASRVEMPDNLPSHPRRPRSFDNKSVVSNEGSHTKSTSCETPSESDAAKAARGVRAHEHHKPKPIDDDHARVKPQSLEEAEKIEIKPKPQSSTLPDDGIRVRPMRPDSRDSSTVRAPSITRPSKRPSENAKEPSRHRVSSARKEVRDPEFNEPKIPRNTSLPTRAASRPVHPRPKRPRSIGDGLKKKVEDVSDANSWTSGSELESDIPSGRPQKPLADIPFGSSAFSELELSRGLSRRPTIKPKADRPSGFKDATNALKKALSEGKKILTEKVDPPRPVANRPRNIESWLRETVDPFVDCQDENEDINKDKDVDEPQQVSTEKARVSEKKSHHSISSSQHKSADHDEDGSHHKSNEPRTVSRTSYDGPRDEAVLTASPSGLKRTRTTRIPPPTGMNANKRGLKEKIRDAFRGESAVYTSGRTEYSSSGNSVDEESEHRVEHKRRHRPSTMNSTPNADDGEDSSISAEPTTPKSSSDDPKRRAQPKSSLQDLSTTMSGAEMLSMLHSELSSNISETTLSQTTMTRNTGLTRSTAVSRKRSQKPELKRRLTKHSDLVSVLSLPNDDGAPSRNRSLRSTHSVRRASNRRDATVESLLREFARDEDLYSRELKTLVAGVIPVLLSQCVNGGEGASGDLFGSPNGTHKGDPLPKAVVNMGVVLEKLRNHHRRCPLDDIHQLPEWLETAAPIYGHYLDVWRLGFQGIIVNLAPASPDDEDSLMHAMPRNEQGDLLNQRGDRIDVAHLLKRPLVRTKWITRFIQGYRAATGTTQYESLMSRWEVLQDKARKRHKEETARVVDDDARNTDTSRTRDLRNMAAAENVKIDRFRQVYAKDSFSLDLRHSNGQRLNCQVELIYRDNQLFKSDTGDLLIREIGDGGRSWLLFAPVTGDYVSARRGHDKFQLVIMIRGYEDEWSELVTLTTDNEEQILDWLQMLGSNPLPPEVHELPPSFDSKDSVLSTMSKTSDPPLGERQRYPQRSTSSSTPSPSPSRNPEEEAGSLETYHQQHLDSPTRAPPAIPSSEKTLARDSSNRSRRRISGSPPQVARRQSTHAQEDIHSDLRVLEELPDDNLHKDDSAPAPPMHRSLDAKSAALAPPAEPHSRGKRQSSSPLKHEYYPSDESSKSSFSESESENDYSYSDESSDDELEAVDMPDGVPAISIKKEAVSHRDKRFSGASKTRVSSLLDPQRAAPNMTDKGSAYVSKALATISYWDDKRGCWKDLWPDICSIVITPGLIEAYPFRRIQTPGESNQEEDRPLIALDLTPLVMLRTSTALDIEIRSPVLSYARLYNKLTKIEASFFRFRASSLQECESLYSAVHRARLDNAKYKALEEETRVRAFGQGQMEQYDGDEMNQRRGWFGRRNSYRASARAPSQSAGSTSHSSVSASSFLKKLMGGGGQFNIARSSIHRQSRFGSGENSLYASSSGILPRSPSVSAANSGAPARSLTTNNLKIRLHLLVSSSKWEDYGNCYLEVARPDQGTRQDLRKYQGMEKRIIVTSIPRKSTENSQVVLDVVLGSRCFSRLGSRGVLLNVWEEVRDEHGEMGVAPKGGGSGGNVNKWCFQCVSVMEASWIYGLVTQEVVIG